jgi:pyruvate/2-oxoacid:ferredoxin oxidoreductase beta subunit
LTGLFYHKHYVLGTDSRDNAGWFSWWRHGTSGQSKAKELQNGSKEQPDSLSILIKLRNHFVGSKTKYENHSLSSFILDELNSRGLKYVLISCDGDYNLRTLQAINEVKKL